MSVTTFRGPDDLTLERRRKFQDIRRASKFILAELKREEERAQKFAALDAALKKTKRKV